MIKDFQIESVGEALLLTTGIYEQKQRNGATSEFFSRSFKINSFLNDGMPSAGAIFQQGALDIVIYDSIEVVRGATGILQGTGSASASINLMRKRASEYFAVDTSASVGSWNNRRVDVDATLPLSDDDSLNSRFILAYQDKEHFADFHQEDKTVFYGTIDKTFSDSANISVGIHKEESDTDMPYAGVPHTQFTMTEQGETVFAFSNLPREKSMTAPGSFTKRDVETVFVDANYTFNDVWNVKASFSHTQSKGNTNVGIAIGGFEAQSGTGLLGAQTTRAENTINNNFDVRITGNFEDFVLPTQLVIGANSASYKRDSNVEVLGPIRLFEGAPGPAPVRLGSIYSDDLHSQAPSGGMPMTRNEPVHIDHRSVTISAKTELTENLTSVIGFKLNDYQQVEDFSRGSFAPTPAGFVPFSVEYYDVTDIDRTNPYIGLVYDFNEDYTVYASHTDIFTPQTLRDEDGFLLDPVLGTNQEIGFKGEFFNDRLTTTVAFFRLDQDNVGQQTNKEIPDGRPAYIEVDNTKVSGYELEVVGFVSDNWQINFGFSDNEAENKDGQDLYTDLPKRLIKLQSRYDFSDYVDGLNVGFGINSVSDHKSVINRVNMLRGAMEAQDYEYDDYTLVNLYVNYAITENLSANLTVNNLTDKSYYSNAVEDSAIYGTPRDVRLRVSYSF
jgi:outer membrane receptor for ferric coprogen and ferric-rhodotorulic acid